MWLIVYREGVGWGELERRVLDSLTAKPPEGAYNEALFEIKEWGGPVPDSGDPERLPDLDPTLDDPDYPDFQEARGRFDELAEQATAEIEWLEETIPQIEAMTVVEVRAVVKRLAQENLRCIRAWRYVIRRLR